MSTSISMVDPNTAGSVTTPVPSKRPVRHDPLDDDKFREGVGVEAKQWCINECITQFNLFIKHRFRFGGDGLAIAKGEGKPGERSDAARLSRLVNHPLFFHFCDEMRVKEMDWSPEGIKRMKDRRRSERLSKVPRMVCPVAPVQQMPLVNIGNPDAIRVDDERALQPLEAEHGITEMFAIRGDSIGQRINSERDFLDSSSGAQSQALFDFTADLPSHEHLDTRGSFGFDLFDGNSEEF